MSTPAPSGRRERVRGATIAEIKAAALALMQSAGSTEIRLSDVARAVQLTPPGLYRYFADREALLTALVADAYAELADALTAAAADPTVAPAGRFAAVCHAYRAWGLGAPQRLDLVFGAPLPGYATPEEAGTTASAHRAMAALRDAAGLTRVAGRGGAGPVAEAVGPALRAAGVDAGEQALLQVWALLHGAVTLETFGHLDWLPQAARDDFFDAQVALAHRAAGLTPP